MGSYIFGTPHSSRKTRTVTAESLEDAVIIFRTEELYPELYVKKEMIERVIEDRPYPYDPVLELIPGAYIEIYDDWGKDAEPAATIPCADVLSVPLCMENQKLLAGDAASAKDVPSKREDTAITKAGMRSAMDSLIAKKMELEKQLDLVKAEMALMEEKLSDAAKTLRLMKNYAGIDADLVLIKDGSPAPEDEPLTIYQSKLFMDENVGILNLFEGRTDSLDVRNIDEFDRWIADNFMTFMPAEKALTVWQIRREAKQYALGCDAESELFNQVMNHGNFQTYFLIRNGERLWRFTSDFHVPDEVFPKLREKRDWFSESQLKNDTEKRLFALAALQGIIDHTDILGTRLGDKGINLLRPVAEYDEKDIVFIRDAEPDQFITDGRPRWKEYLEKNQEGIHKGSRIMPVVSFHDIVRDDGWGEKWNAVRSTNSRCLVYSVPDAGEVYTVEDVDNSYWGTDGLKVLFNPKDEVYRYQGDWVSGHQRMTRIGFRYFRDEVIDVDAISFEDIDYYLKSRVDRPDYISMLPLLARLWKWKKKEHEEETPFSMLIASKAEIDWSENEERIRSVIHWWKTKNRIKRAVTKDDALAFRMCLKKLKEEIR